MQCREDGEIDMENFKAMVDLFLDAGFNYFDTAHVYFDGKSELALREGLTSRYPREAYVLTNKLTSNCFETEADILPLFQKQLELCGVEYFDFYLIHSVLQSNYPKILAVDYVLEYLHRTDPEKERFMRIYLNLDGSRRTNPCNMVALSFTCGTSTSTVYAWRSELLSLLVIAATQTRAIVPYESKPTR